MIVFNLVGLAIFALSFGIATGLSKAMGLSSEGLLMLLGGPLATTLDLAYRKLIGKHWLRPSAGGSLFFIPVWLLGIVWGLLGIYYQTSK
jgi:hypothetical protein